MAPVLAYGAGVVFSEIYQWGAWKIKNLDKGWFGYWAIGLPHLAMNIGGIVIIGALWQVQLLDDITSWTVTKMGMSDWANVGIPFTPQIGLLLGFCADLVSDNLAFLVRKVFSRFSGKEESNG